MIPLPPQQRAPLSWTWPDSPHIRRGRKDRWNGVLRLPEEARWRYVNLRTGHVVLWTTQQLYEGGNFAAYLISPHDEVLERFESPIKLDCRAMCSVWAAQLVPEHMTYLITEEP